MLPWQKLIYSVHRHISGLIANQFYWLKFVWSNVNFFTHLSVDSKILATHIDEDWTPHFQLGLDTKVFKFQIFVMVGLTMSSVHIKINYYKYPQNNRMWKYSNIFTKMMLTHLKMDTVALSTSFHQELSTCLKSCLLVVNQE